MSANASTITAADIDATLTYYTRVDGRAVVYQGEPGKESKRVGEFDQQRMPIFDARAINAELDLDVQGFKLEHSTTDVTDFYDDRQVEGIYYPEVRDLLTRLTGASRVHIFDHTIRVEDPAKREARLRRAPVQMVHNDYTERSGPQRVMDLIDERERDTWLGARFAVINVWRSINGPVKTKPIAVADARSIKQADLVLTDLVYPDRVGEIYYIAHNPEHRWYYLPEIGEDEALLIKSYDSAQDGRARFTPHTAFELPHESSDSPARESIEVRALASFA